MNAEIIEENGHLYHCDTEMKWFDHDHPEGGDCHSVECFKCGLIALDCEDYK